MYLEFRRRAHWFERFAVHHGAEPVCCTSDGHFRESPGIAAIQRKRQRNRIDIGSMAARLHF